jgi:hypothetical protein
VDHFADRERDSGSPLPKPPQIARYAEAWLARADGGATYEQAVADWQRSGGERGFPPIPEDVDERQLAIRIGETLGMPAPDVLNLSPLWIRDALIRLRIDAMQHERAMKKAEQRRKKTAPPQARKR